MLLLLNNIKYFLFTVSWLLVRSDTTMRFLHVLSFSVSVDVKFSKHESKIILLFSLSNLSAEHNQMFALKGKRIVFCVTWFWSTTIEIFSAGTDASLCTASGAANRTAISLCAQANGAVHGNWFVFVPWMQIENEIINICKFCADGPRDGRLMKSWWNARCSFFLNMKTNRASRYSLDKLFYRNIANL